MPRSARFANLILKLRFDLPLDVRFGHRKFVRLDQLVDQLVFRLLLRGVFAFGKMAFRTASRRSFNV